MNTTLGGVAILVGMSAASPILPPFHLDAQRNSIDEAQQTLARLVESYGVSGMEAPVRETVRSLLPPWAKAETDTAGNLWLRAGSGSPTTVIIAHLDEIGFSVTGVREDGSLELVPRGGFFLSLYEAKPALVHTGSGMVPGVFMPRDSSGPPYPRTPTSLRVDVGTGSRSATEALGIRPGNTVTMPKQYVRLAGTRATGGPSMIGSGAPPCCWLCAAWTPSDSSTR